MANCCRWPLADTQWSSQLTMPNGCSGRPLVVGRRRHVGLSEHLTLSVAMTAMVRSAATGNVGLEGCGFQCDRTGSFHRV